MQVRGGSVPDPVPDTWASRHHRHTVVVEGVCAWGLALPGSASQRASYDRLCVVTDTAERCPYCDTALASDTDGALPSEAITQTCPNPECPGKHGPESVAVGD